MIDCRVMTGSKKYFVFYDNLCLVCGGAQRFIRALDWLHKIETIPIYDTNALKKIALPIPPTDTLLDRVHLIHSDGTVLSGFLACRKIGLLLPLTFPIALILYIPGTELIGEPIYKLLARNRR